MLGDYFAGCTETLILLPKKNGKTTLMAALALFHLITTEDAECIIAAASVKQASIMYRQATGFVRRSPKLQQRVVVKKGSREIRSLADDGRIHVIAGDVETADGAIPTLAIVDELHRHKNDDLYGILRDGLGPRNGRILTISTAGDDEESPLGRMRRAAHRLPHVHRKRGTRHTYCRSADRAFVMHEWALRRTDKRNDMACVKLANPASFQTEDKLRSRFNSPTMKPWQWARYACGIWERGEDTKIQPDDFDRLVEAGTIIPPGTEISLGWDAAWRIDCNVLVPLWMERDDRRVFGKATIFEPPRSGSIDELSVVAAMLQYDIDYVVTGIVYDPNAGAQQMVQQLEQGIHPLQTDDDLRARYGLPPLAEAPARPLTFIEHSQDNAPMSQAARRLDEAMRTGAVRIAGEQWDLRAHWLNAVELKLGAEKWRYDRPKRGARVPIDGLTAALFVHDDAVAELEGEPAPDRSLYRMEFIGS